MIEGVVTALTDNHTETGLVRFYQPLKRTGTYSRAKSQILHLAAMLANEDYLLSILISQSLSRSSEVCLPVFA